MYIYFVCLNLAVCHLKENVGLKIAFLDFKCYLCNQNHTISDFTVISFGVNHGRVECYKLNILKDIIVSIQDLLISLIFKSATFDSQIHIPCIFSLSVQGRYYV